MLRFKNYMIFLGLLLINIAIIECGVFCYICYGLSSNEGNSCNFNGVCYGEACIMTMNTRGQWNSTCANNGSSSLYAQLNGTQCVNGSIPGLNGTYATCACSSNFCNRPDMLTMNFSKVLNSTRQPLSPPMQNPLTCFECGTVEGEPTTLGSSEVNVTCDGTRTCQGTYCLTRKSIIPRSYCASPWMGTLNLGCTKRKNEDELCACNQSMCNYPYDPLQDVPFVSTMSTISIRTTPPGAPCVDGFRIISSNTTVSSASGKFGGYFQFPSSCQELCKLNYGLLPCLGFMYEPNNRGKCTIFQYAINGYVTSPNSTTIVYERCT